MKKKLILATIIVMAAFTACEKNFDPKIYGVLTSHNYPVSENDYITMMMACYTPYINTWMYTLYSSSGNQHPWYIPAGGVIRQFDEPTDEMAPWMNGAWDTNYRQYSEANFSNGVYYPRNNPDDTRPNNYPKTREVTRFTEIIGVLEGASTQKVSPQRKNEIIAEARLCRGLHMYNLLHLYGPVPVIVNPEDVGKEEALNNAVRPSLDDMTQWIYDDFDFAAQNAPETQADRGRFTRDFGRVMLMRHCLNEGYHKDGWYQKAKELYSELNTGKYNLFRTGENPYKEMFREENDFNVEIIAAISCDPSSTGNNKEGGMNPFFMLSTPNNCAKKDDLGNPTPFAVTGPGWGMVFNISPKFYDTFETGDLRKENIITRYYTVGGEWWGPNEIGKKGEWDGYIPYKYPAETATAPCMGNDFPLARWADVLLMYAEADVRVSGSAPSNDAIDAVNLVRQRAGLGPLAAKYTDTADHFLDALLTERGHEFWYEGLRKIDLIRFNQYAQRCRRYKQRIPSHQYLPIPNYAVEEAENAGVVLEQTYFRDGWEEDLDKARSIK